MPRGFVNPNFNYEPDTNGNDSVDLTPITDALGQLKRAVMSNVAPKSVEVENIDRIKLYLRQELDGVIKAVKAVKEAIPTPPKAVEVTNFPKSEKAPDNVKVNNLDELGDKLAKLLEAVQGLNVNPIVNVPAPIVNVPEQPQPIVNVPQALPPILDLDLSALLAALKPLNLLSRDPNKPITVRMSDGRHFIDALTQTLKDNGERLATVVSTSYGLTKSEFKQAATELGLSTADLTDTNTKLDTIHSDLDGVEGKLDSIIANTSGSLDKYVLHASDDYTTTSVTYLCKMKTDGTWLFTKVDETGNFAVFTYANVSNNATKTTYALAYTDRTTLNYANLNTLTGV
jgi:hypothetical protein